MQTLIVYGSRARGEASPDSDMDIAIILDEKTPDIEAMIEDAAYDLMWRNDFNPVLSVKVFAQSRFLAALEKGYSFYRNIATEGIAA
jgi:predicted nucleotidyltransferase